MPSTMVDHTKEGDAAIKVFSGGDTGVRKFTLSCSRCRASKLKCDKKEPCMECVRRNVGHLCTKDERQPRAKRAKTADNGADNSKTKANASPTQETEAEEAARALEKFIDGAACTDAYPSAALEPTLPSVAPDHPNTYWLNTSDPQKQNERFCLIREIVDAMLEQDITRLLYDVFVTRCQSPLGNVIHTPTFLKQAEKLYSCLGQGSPEAQVMALCSTVSMDELACHLLALVLALAFHPTPSLHGWYPTPQTLRVEEVRASDLYSKRWRSLALRCLRGNVSLFSGSIASLQAAIMLLLDGQDGPLELDAILVTAVSGAQKLGLHRLGDAKLDASASPSSSQNGASNSMEMTRVRTEVGIRIWWALVMRDWSRGQALAYYSVRPSQFNTRMPLNINDEDLCSTTLKIDIRGHVTERPRTEFTNLSYTVHALEIAVLARESIDLRGPLLQAQKQDDASGGAKTRNHLNKKYENFVAGLPSYFRLGSSMGLNSQGPMAAMPIQRWMLHQQLWGLFLRLHRANFSSHDGRASCQLLAQNIISNQAQIRARCAVCGSLSISKTQLFNAATVLLVDLLFSTKQKDEDSSSAQLSRLMIKDKIREAIELLRTQSDIERSPSPQDTQWGSPKPSAQRGVLVLEALMKLEEEESSKNEESNGATSSGARVGRQGSESNGGSKKSLKDKVMDVLDALQENAQNAAVSMQQPGNPNGNHSFPSLDMPMPMAPPADGFGDLDVLPVLSNDPSTNFWQFLDFAPPQQQPSLENGFFSGAEDWQALTDTIPYRPSPVGGGGAVHPMNGFATTELPDMYSDTDGTRFTHTSPSSIESGPTRLSGGSETATTPSSTDVYVAAGFC
ncbi:MAG: hypothetical protein Q9216_005754 [Gyalolechia sp. 2 TL-2023]